MRRCTDAGEAVINASTNDTVKRMHSRQRGENKKKVGQEKKILVGFKADENQCQFSVNV